MVFRINGEYGYELFAAVPLVNWYKEQGNDVEVYSSIGAGLLYPNIKVNEMPVALNLPVARFVGATQSKVFSDTRRMI